MHSHIIIKNDNGDIHKTGVYKLYYTQEPGVFYIGSASSHKGRKGKIGFARRLSCHIQKLRSGKHYSHKLQSGFNKYGINSLRMSILEICDPLDCKHVEQLYLDELHPAMNTFTNAFNATGYRHRKESINAMSAQRKGRVMTEKAKQNMSMSRKGIAPSNLPLLLSREVKDRAAEGRRKVVRWDSWYNKIRKPVDQFELNGCFIKTHRSSVDAYSETNIDKSSIANCCAGRRKTAGGYTWAYSKANR